MDIPKAAGAMPWAFLDIRPLGYSDYWVGVPMPGGKSGYLVMGRAVEGTAIEALEGFFNVDLLPKYNQYLLLLDLDRMKVQVSPSPSGRAGTENINMTITMELEIYESSRGRLIYTAQIKAEGSSEVGTSSEADYMAGITRLAEEVLAEAGQNMFEEVKKSASTVKYKTKR